MLLLLLWLLHLLLLAAGLRCFVGLLLPLLADEDVLHVNSIGKVVVNLHRVNQ